MALLEVCAATRPSLLAAIAAGAERVELCEDLAVGGVTPSADLIREAVAAEGLRVHVLIRCRAGSFVYTAEEVALMTEQIRQAKALGADGVVIGALTPEGDVDLSACRQWVAAAEGMSITFHRAFDRCRHPQEALEEIIRLGCHRLLTSGQADTAYEGRALIADLVRQAAGRLLILPGAGVNPSNAAAILSATGATELHSSARSTTSHPHSDPTTISLILSAITEGLPPC